MVNALIRRGAAALATGIFLFGSQTLWGPEKQIVLPRQGRTLVLSLMRPASFASPGALKRLRLLPLRIWIRRRTVDRFHVPRRAYAFGRSLRR